MIHRLARLLDALSTTTSSTLRPTATPAGTLERLAGLGIGIAPARFSSVASRNTKTAPVGQAGDEGGGRSLVPPVAIAPSSPLFWIFLLVVATCLWLLVFRTLLRRDAFPSFRGGLVSVRRVEELRALALTVLLAGVLALGLVLVLV
jgi:hypothetical protein